MRESGRELEDLYTFTEHLAPVGSASFLMSAQGLETAAAQVFRLWEISREPL